MIKNLQLKFGRGVDTPPLNIETTPVVVFVGPNNSGKSKILEEINLYCTEGRRPQNNLLIDSLTFHEFSLEKAKKYIDHAKLTPYPNEAVQADHAIIGNGRFGRSQVPENKLLEIIQQPNRDQGLFTNWFLRHNTLMLSGRNRIDLASDKPVGDLQRQSENSFQTLFTDEAKRKEVRRIVYESFGLYFVIDPTSLGQLRLRLSSTPPNSVMEEIGIHPEARSFHSKALPVQQASDGVKAFTGIITEIIAGDPKVLLIDEPEAFLHPSLAYNLGKEIAQASAGADKGVFISTHSPSFVMGCIQSGSPVTIVRLTYRGSIATARVLPNDEILRLMRNPLLRSTRVLEGLFYEYVVVTESDADRAFYQEINDRLLRFKPEWGIPNCLFINAQNKQTVQTIISPLRQLGIPSAGIVDIDILKEGGTVWTNHLSSGFVPDVAFNSFSTLRNAIKQKMESTGKDMKRDGGVEILSHADKEAANNLFDQLDEYGLFTVRFGELEYWLKDFQAVGHGPNWLIDIFQKMGEDPEQETYLKPGDDDVWLFMSKIKSWFSKVDKKGIPV